MANNTILNQRNYKELLDAFEHYFPSNTVYSADKKFTSLYSDYTWNNRNEFIDFIYRLTGIQIKSAKDVENIKKAQFELDKITTKESETKIVEAPKQPAATTPQNLKDLEAANKLRSEAIKQTQEEAKRTVKEAIERKKLNIKEELQDKKLYVKVKTPDSQKPDKNVQQFINEAKLNPRQFRKDASEVIKKQIANSSIGKNLPKEELNILADKVTFDAIQAINYPSKQVEKDVQTAILNAIPKEKSVVNSISAKPEVKEFLKNAPKELAFYNNSTGFSRSVLNSVNPNLSVTVFGPDPDSIEVSFFPRPVNNFTHKIDLGSLSNSYTSLTEHQSDFIGQFTSMGKDETQRFLLGRARFFLDSQIAQLPEGSIVSSLYNSGVGQKVLNIVGLSEYSPIGGFFEFVGKIPGASGYLQSVGNALGIDFGFVGAAPLIEGAVAETAIPLVAEGTLAATTATGVVATEAVGTALSTEVIGGAITAETATTAVGAEAGATVGSAGGFVGAIVGAIIGFVVSKINWRKLEGLKPYALGILVGGVALLFSGPVVALIAGFSATALFSSFTGGGLAAIGGGIVKFFGFITTFLATIFGLPALITMAITPILVTLILFIINSGAYIVPAANYGQINCDLSSSGETGVETKINVLTGSAAQAAVCLVSYLNKYGLNPLLESLLGTPAWDSLANAIPAPALDALELSAHVGDGAGTHLQCVGFVSATAGWAYGQAFDQINACSYINNAPSGYKYVSGTSGIRSGDFFLINGLSGCSSGSPGHIGVVTSVDGALISCADANAIAPGKARVSNGCYELIQLAGYLRKD